MSADGTKWIDMAERAFARAKAAEADRDSLRALLEEARRVASQQPVETAADRASERAYAISMSSEQISLNEALKASSGETVTVRAADLMAVLTELDVAVFHLTVAEADRATRKTLLQKPAPEAQRAADGEAAAGDKPIDDAPKTVEEIAAAIVAHSLREETAIQPLIAAALRAERARAEWAEAALAQMRSASERKG